MICLPDDMLAVCLPYLRHTQGSTLLCSIRVPAVPAVCTGDAILFHSEKMHNVAPITQGLRHSFVMEIWQGKPNRNDRQS